MLLGCAILHSMAAAADIKLTQVAIIDGTGGPVAFDQSIVIEQGRIAWVGRSDHEPREYRNLKALELRGRTVIPGIVGMHNHLFYTASLDYDEHFHLPPPGPLVNEIAYSAPWLYLAAGVTAMRTTGSMETYTDLNLKAQIDAGTLAGPDLDVTGPYLQGPGGSFSQMHTLRDVADARNTVAFWAEQGVTSFKAYTHITRAELAAAIAEVHRRGLKITGHLCSVSYREAADLGIDNLEHGPIYSDSGLVENRAPDECPTSAAAAASWLKHEVSDPQVTELIQLLIARKVAITSTLPVFEARLPGRPGLPQRFLSSMASEARESYLLMRARIPPSADAVALFEKEMRADYCSPARTPRGLAACCLDSAISGVSSCWLKPVSRPWRPSRLPRPTAPDTSTG